MSATRAVPSKIAKATYANNKSFYDNIPARSAATPSVNASVKLLSGCQDWEFSYDGDQNGQFTGAPLKTWDDAAFTGNYQQFRDEIVTHIRTPQSPNLKNIGIPNLEFDLQKPFSLS